MRDTVRRFLIIMSATLIAYFFLHVLRSFSVAPEARGICAGVAGYMMGDLVASTGVRRRRRS